MSDASGTSLCSSKPQTDSQVNNKENRHANLGTAPKPVPLPTFALKHAAVAVSLSTSISSDLSMPDEQAAPVPVVSPSGALQPEASMQTTPNTRLLPQELAQPDYQPTVLQLLTQLDSIKWDTVANWASKDSAEAAALCDRLVPLMAESVIEQEQGGSDSISRLELQVARKKLASVFGPVKHLNEYFQ